MTVKLPYAPVKRGNRFWQPTKAMRDLGFLAKPLGADGPESQAEALRLYNAFLEAKRDAGKVTDYPNGSLGSYYDRFRRTTKWAKKAQRTHDDYARAWKHIEPAFARKTLTQITADQCEAFSDGLDADVSPSERYRTMKVLRALLTDAKARLNLSMQNPALAVPNPQPRGRNQIWLGAELQIMWEGAWTMGLHGMSIAIRVAWDTLFSPVDVRTAAKSQVKRDGAGAYIERARTKTDKEAFGALTQATAEALDAYLAEFGADLLPDAPIIRQRNGEAYRTKDTFAADFRDVRNAFFPGDTRQFLDIRRSGNVEADAAGADKATMGELLANTIATSRFLDDTYTPPTVTKARQVAEQRLEGRSKLAAETTRIRSNNIR